MQKFNNGNKMCDKNEKLQQKQRQWLGLEELLTNIKIPDMLLSSNQNSQSKVVLFGVGIYGEMALQYFKSMDIIVSYFCDNDITKHDKIVDNVKVISPTELCKIDNSFVIITSKHYVYEISKQLSKMNLNHISFDAYFIKKSIDQYEKMYFDLLNEERSEFVIVKLLKSMITGEREFCSNVMEDNAFYAIPIFKTTDNEIFVDAGAYVGDTLEQFIWNNIGSFRKIYAFEPGTRQFDAMQIRIKRLVEEWAIDKDKIICVKAGLGENDAILPFADDQTSLSSNNFVATNDINVCNVAIHSLDNFMKDESVTMIKADIEGFEIEMLKGARNIIKRCKPKLAISIYHKPEDMFKIPMFIHEIVPEYNMAIRHHSAKLLETVLYCWI